MKMKDCLLEQSIEFLIKIKSNLMEILFSNEEGSNLAYKNFIVESINIYLKTNGKALSEEISGKNIQENPSKNPVLDLLDYIISFLTNNEAAKNWTKIAAYLEFWDSFAKSGDVQLEYLYSKEMIAKLIDFFLMKESPFYKAGENRYEMGNRLVNPKFAGLISTLSTLIRHSFTETWNEEDHSKGLKPHTFLEGKVR